MAKMLNLSAASNRGDSRPMNITCLIFSNGKKAWNLSKRFDAGLTRVQVAGRLKNHNSGINKSENGGGHVDVIQVVESCNISGVSTSQLRDSAGLERRPPL